ncbi:MAG TPA: response regulator [Candidatus Wirthbacteria bacterium]|nr:response regulator [Candidatus Wirthbacteria bacterium]
MNCPKCAYLVPEGVEFSFCPKCGNKLEFVAPAPPVAPPPVEQVNESLDQMGIKAQSSPKRILIVEDDLFIRELYQKQLEIAGYEVESAVDGMEAREKIFTNPYDLVLLDIMLPKMNGLDLLKIVKENPNTATLPMIILSNLGQDSIVERGLALGADNFIVKAEITPLEMLAVIKERIGV